MPDDKQSSKSNLADKSLDDSLVSVASEGLIMNMSNPDCLMSRSESQFLVPSSPSSSSKSANAATAGSSQINNSEKTTTSCGLNSDSLQNLSKAIAQRYSRVKISFRQGRILNQIKFCVQFFISKLKNLDLWYVNNWISNLLLVKEILLVQSIEAKKHYLNFYNAINQ